MDNTQVYVQGARERLAVNGFSVSEHVVGGLPAVVGYKSEFHWRWMATRMHLFVFVAGVDSATYGTLAHFTDAALEYADKAKGAYRGFQSGIAAIATISAPEADPRALAMAKRDIVRKFAGFAWPVLFDSASRTLTSHVGRPRIGGIYTKWMREQIATCLDPGSKSSG